MEQIEVRLEKSILGACILERSAFSRVHSILSSDCFVVSGHSFIWDAMNQLNGSSTPIDLITVTSQLRKNNKLSDVGGALYVTQLTQAVASSANIEHHAAILVGQKVDRDLLAWHKDSIKNQTTQSVEERHDKLLKYFDYWQTIILKFKKIEDFNSQISETIKNIEKAEREQKISGLPTSSEVLDRILGGFQKGELILLAARPSIGKTARALHVIYNASQMGKSIYFASIEMKSQLIIHRLLAMHTGIDSNVFKNPYNKNLDWGKVNSASGSFGDWKFTLDDRGDGTTAQIQSGIKNHITKFGSLDLVVIDYAQFIQSPEKRGVNREQEIRKISYECKAMAKKENVPVMLLSQLSRNCETRSDKRPMLSDLRESGSLEQDADIVIGMYRPSKYYVFSGDPDYNKDGHHECQQYEYESIVELHVLKNRNGATGEIKEFFDPKTGRYSSQFHEIEETRNLTKLDF